MTEQEKLNAAQKKISELISIMQHRFEMLEDDASHDANFNSKFYKQKEAGAYRSIFYDLCELQNIVRG